MKLSDRVKLCRESLNLSQEDVAKLIGMSQPSYQRIEKDKVKNPSRLNKIAEIFKTTSEWLEYGSGAGPSYLDLSTIPDGKIPLLPWGAVKKWVHSYDIDQIKKLVAEEEIEFISVPNKSNTKQFALRVHGDFMISPIAGKRTFLENDIIIIDSDIPFKEGDYVIAIQPHEEEILFMQYISYGGKHYLKPLNSQYPLIDFNPKTIRICGVVIAHLDVLI